MPVIGTCQNQWDALIALRGWIKKQIPNKDPVIKSHWDAQRILQAVWNDPSRGFICDAHAASYVSACVSAGLNARMLHLGDGNGNGHYAAEVWSDDHKKWIFMDPLYDCHFSKYDVPLSALELHNLWKNGGIGEIAKHGDGAKLLKIAEQSSDYYNLFQDIQLINCNDFLTAPFTNSKDLLSLRIRFIRYIDKTNPPYNKLHLTYQLLMFYYVPIIISSLIIPFVIPAYLIYIVMTLGKQAASKPIKT
jgi:hypothetical protein